MFVYTIDACKWNRMSLYLGSIAWVSITFARIVGWVTVADLNLLLLLALTVITPLALSLLPTVRERNCSYYLATWMLFLQPFATLVSAISLLSDKGLFAVIESLVWFVFTLLLALFGVLLLFQHYPRHLSTANLAVALIYVPIGSIWLVLDRLSLQPIGFSPTIVLLTAVHFHFITLAALLMVGLTGQTVQMVAHKREWTFYRVLAACMLVNPLLVAIGITTTRITGLPWLESATAMLFALCMIGIAVFSLRFIVPTTTSPLARVLLLVSSTAIVLTMILAGAYTLGETTGWWTITISQMILLHGWINALVFGLCGLLGWRIRITQERSRSCAL